MNWAGALVLALAASGAAVGGHEQQQAPPQPAGTGRISGTVVAADNGAPVKRANVMIVGYGGVPPRDGMPPQPPSGRGTIVIMSELSQSRGTMRQVQVTDESGRFEFTDLPAGRYSLAVQPQGGFVRNQRSQSILVTDGGTARVNFRLERTGAIAGRILDESGEPLPRVRVSALRKGGAGGPSMSASATTDDLGQFRLFDLQPGDYLVSGTPMETMYAPDNAPEQGYAPTFYPGTPSADTAQAIEVRSGQDAPNIIFSLARVPMGKITGTVRDSSGQQIANAGRGAVGVSVSLGLRDPAGSGMSRGSGLRPDGSFVIGSIAPGDYYLSASSNQGSGPGAVREGTFTRVTINGDAQHVDLQLNRGAVVSGRVQFEGDPAAVPDVFRRAAAGPARVNISVRPVPGGPPQFGGLNPATVAEDGTFQLSGLRGLVLLTAMGAPGAVVKSIVHGADDLSRQPVEFTGVEHLKDVVVTMTYETGRIEGMATDAKGAPVTEATVVIFSDDPDTWFPGSPHVFLTRTMPDDAGGAQLVAPPGMSRRLPGSFMSPPLAVGVYYVAAIDSALGVYTGVPSGKEAFERLRKTAARVTVRAGQTAEVSVRASRQ